MNPSHTDQYGKFFLERRADCSESPKVSVVMSVYNGAAHLEESISSVLRQTFRDFEFLICDDGSTDKSRNIIRAYFLKDSRIVAVSQNNLGLTKTLNRLIGLARGRYIARQDADDISHPDRLQAQVAFLDTKPRITAL